ncbi:hypothetical protein DFQ04_0644 [Algoriphagus boseongensis]|uniref:Tryptophan-rich sensory protein n=1 Tax=Algoriphagus boseongensis TaxID=1442587 RepID=A0A4R6T818_9BACT|nr:hypothetical protein [Algoriphagus boseongensis]TDQ18836.1 hypothetical protein DFQ04_0644 [Algoriphagus boseongensis]
MNRLTKYIASIESQLSLNAWLKAILLALSIRLILFLVGVNDSIQLILGAANVSVFAYLFGGFRRHRQEALALIHQRAGNLEFSLELLEKKKFSLADQLQLERIASQIPPRIWIFHKGLWIYVIGLAVVYALTWLVPSFTGKPNLLESTSSQESELVSETVTSDAFVLSQASLEIISPAYTRIPKRTQESLEVQAIRGSMLTWNLQFSSEKDLEVFLVNSAGEKLSFSSDKNRYSLREELLGSGLYSIQALENGNLVFESELYTLESIEDQSPEIVPEEKENYRFFFLGNNPKFNLKADIKDDFLVTQVEIIATLARGRGENVKFREVRFPVEKAAFSSKNSSFILDVSALDFQPGDELYYYWQAKDNKAPEPNFSRTDTYFLKYYDEKDDQGMAMEGMAIQVLPEYFRSQRQIIIDTEKLIAEKGKKADKDFNFTSNEIGYDQKLLRLRYGQYLGEEFESDAGGAIEESEDGDLLTGFMHLHDQEGEHEADFRPVETHQEHGAEKEQEEGIESLLSEFMHAHDDGELNTYYEQSTRGALKSALDQMWQAELYLRLFEPEKSLPYQYKALEMLKTVQQKSRVYIKKTGYDPPPIKEEEKRLSGKLTDLEKQIQKDQTELEKEIEPLASEVLGLLVKTQLSVADKGKISELGSLWALRMQNSGLQDWSLLRYLRELELGQLDENGKNYLREKLYPLAKSYKSTNSSYLGVEALKSSFRKQRQ